MATTIGIRELTRHTSEVVHRAAAGESMVITEHDRPIAILGPLPRTGDPAIDELVLTGKLTPPSNPGGIAALLAIEPVPASTVDDSTDIVSELRQDRG